MEVLPPRRVLREALATKHEPNDHKVGSAERNFLSESLPSLRGGLRWCKIVLEISKPCGRTLQTCSFRDIIYIYIYIYYSRQLSAASLNVFSITIREFPLPNQELSGLWYHHFDIA